MRKQILPALAAALAIWTCSAAMAQTASAVAQMTAVQTSSTTWHYDITLDNVGSTQIGTFWFSWLPGIDLMTSPASNIQSPIGWSGTDTNFGSFDGHAVEWQLVPGSGYFDNPGDSTSGFGFDSAVSPAAFNGQSVFFPAYSMTTSYVYIGFPFNDPGFAFNAAPPPVPTPEPASIAGIGLGAALLLARRRRR